MWLVSGEFICLLQCANDMNTEIGLLFKWPCVGNWVIWRCLRPDWICIAQSCICARVSGVRWQMGAQHSFGCGSSVSFFLKFLFLFCTDSLPWWPQSWLLQSAQSPVDVCSKKPKEKQINGEEKLLVRMFKASTHTRTHTHINFIHTLTHRHTCSGKRET